MLLGLDIGSTALRACAISPSDPKGRLDLFDTEDLPPGAVVNGVITETTQVIDALKEVLLRSAVDAPKVAVTLPHSATIVQSTELPLRRGRHDLKAAQAAIEARIPEAWDDYSLSISPFDELEPSQVLLVAAPKAAILTLEHVVQQAGGQLVGVDAAASVSYNLLSFASVHQGSHAVVDVGLRESRVVIISGGVIRSTAIFPRGGQDLSESLQNALNISAREAELYKLGGIGQPDGVLPRDVHEQLRVACQTLAEAVHRTIEKAASSAGVQKIKTIHYTGRGADIQLFHNALQVLADAPTRPLAPLEQLSCDPFEYTQTYLDAVRGASGFAFGSVLPWTI